MSKDKIKAKYLAGSELKFLSAQDYNSLSDIEKQELKEVLIEQGQDADEYEKKMRARFPKKVTLKELRWRHE